MSADCTSTSPAKPVWNPVSIPDIGSTIEKIAAWTAEMAVHALLREVEAGPKPGLVDRFGPGVHTDMDISHFRVSAAVLRPYFESITRESALSVASLGQPGDSVRGSLPEGLSEDQSCYTLHCQAVIARKLRNLGLQAESAMLAATGGVNTHKGAIWSLGLLCAASGSVAASRIKGSRVNWNAEAICASAARLAQAILSPNANSNPVPDLQNPSRAGNRLQTGMTRGQAARQAYSLRSARDEALEGFPSLRAGALAEARKLRNSRLTEDFKVISVLLAVMTEADDTCIVARGGLPSLQWTKSSARQVIDSGGPDSVAGGFLYRAMLVDFKTQGLSPGGAADLCAAALFLVEIEAGFSFY